MKIVPTVDFLSSSSLSVVDWHVLVLCRCTTFSLVSFDSSLVSDMVERWPLQFQGVWTGFFDSVRKYKPIDKSEGEKNCWMKNRSVRARILASWSVLNKQFHFFLSGLKYVCNITLNYLINLKRIVSTQPIKPNFTCIFSTSSGR